VGGVLAQLAPPADVLRAPASEFVARFVGTERSLKRLSLILVRDLTLAPGDGGAGKQATITDDATLREALDALLASPDRVVRVVDGADGDRGILTLDDITRELRT
jgi:osmoprotectant transport system ATP-binding protein